ncbi:MAG TPA: TVP38/TMEM64 family protein [Desulfomonilia bacterium]
MSEPADNQKPSNKTAAWYKPVVLILVIVAVFILGNVFGIGEKLGQLRSWIESFGSLAPLAYIILYILATVAAVPGVALSLIAATLFGSFRGVIYVSIGSTVGAALAFLVSRYIARNAVAAWLKNNPRFLKLDAMTEEHGAVIVALTRLVPLFPFNLLNYGFGLTKVRFFTYVFWSWLCMLPGTILYLVGFDAVLKGITENRAPWLLILVFLLAAAGVFSLTRFARNRLNRSGNTPEELDGFPK